MDLSSLLMDVFRSHDWEVKSAKQLVSPLERFDFVAENEDAIVFGRVVEAQVLPQTSSRLTADVASATMNARLETKAWESYLVICATGLTADAVEVAQEIQQDLSFCRKVVLDGDRVASARDPAREAEGLLAFLFPLQSANVESAIDVRQALVSKLVEKGTSRSLAEELIENFDELPSCECRARFLQGAVADAEGKQS